MPGLGVMEGPFVISELSYTGEHDAEAGFAIGLVFAEVITLEEMEAA